MCVSVCLSGCVHAWAVSWELYTVVSRPSWPHSNSRLFRTLKVPTGLQGHSKPAATTTEMCHSQTRKDAANGDSWKSTFSKTYLPKEVKIHLIHMLSVTGALPKHIPMPWYCERFWTCVVFNLHFSCLFLLVYTVYAATTCCLCLISFNTLSIHLCILQGWL